ncbi:Acetyltransferase (GNAT) family protein [Friedmanniella luteola]|uniref:Acetyltransferase (GNAT) family protein n=1 Tax=Friedmanniella luteola TaxID=546871 RepID=A0A1H1X5T2_9ACTN|nr:GNAT family N-acetyltransferase [Friedmanniella luteola]SDT03986.1 Acetyltransferase (GNAT) family protein [Friedmanniella luteola]
MPYVRIQPDDHEAVGAAAEILEASRRLDDPTAPEVVRERYAGWLRYGWDLHPEEQFLLVPDGGGAPVGVLAVELPHRDNRHLVWAQITVRPDARRRGHGTAMAAEVLRRTREAGRTTIWMGCAADDAAAAAFLAGTGFHYASPDARRRQRLADVDPAEIARLRAGAEAAASDYELVRLTPPVPEELLAEIAVVAESINDAPMGDLTWEREVYDADLVRDIETAREGRGDRLYRVLARHRGTGVLGGHTMMVTDPVRPTWAFQGDTAVARGHRGHRLGLLLKIEMMAWLAEVEPQVQLVETWNQADNTHMIAVNEALGYRLDRVFHMYERQLDPAAQEQPAGELASV